MVRSTTECLVYRLIACVLSAGLLVTSVRPAPGAEDESARPEPRGHRPTAAFLDLDGSPLSGLLEGRLLENPRAVWVERNAIEEIRRERKLEGLTSAAAGSRRVAVGKLLKADLLALVRHFEKPREHVQLVVCETRQGLRLAVHRIVLSEKVEADADRLAALVHAAIARHGQEIREICAVPAFVSNDLTYENDYLKAAYARLVEQSIGDRPGLLTVELEEARAIGEEVQLAAEGVRRMVPLYVLGEFRHEDKGNGQEATIRIQVHRGKRLLASREASGLSQAEATEFVRRASAELLEETAGIRPLPPNPRLEAEQLARRAETFHRLGGWDEAAGLAEAALLLHGDQPPMRQVAASSLSSLARRFTERRKDPEAVARGIHCYLRALEHYEMLLPEINHVDDPGHTRLHRHVRSAVNWNNLLNEHTSPADVRRIAAELRQRELELLLRMVDVRCRAQTGDEYRFIDWALVRRARQEQFDITLKTIRAVGRLPEAERLARELTLHGFAINFILDNPEGRAYLKQLAAIDNWHLRRVAIRLHDDLERHLAATAQGRLEEPLEPQAPAGPQQIRFEPVKLTYQPEQGEPQVPRSFAGCIPAGAGCDLVWAAWQYVYLMKEPGRLERIWDAGYVKQMGTRINGAKFDGRYAWITTTGLRAEPKLLIVDPQDPRLWEIGRAEGLPVVSPPSLPDRNLGQQLWVEPLEPGRVLLVSWFGRLALSTVTFDPQRGAEIQTFFEARLQPDPSNPEAWRDPHLAFVPRYVVGFEEASEDGNPGRRVLVGGRCMPDDRPLVVDPDSGEVGILEFVLHDGVDPGSNALTGAGFARVEIRDAGLHLVRAGLPDFRPQVVLSNVPEGRCLIRGGRLLVAGSKWWQLDPGAAPQEQIRVLATRQPWAFRNFTAPGQRYAGRANQPPQALKPYRLVAICQSSHFGLLAVRQHRDTHGYEFFQVVFDEE